MARLSSAVEALQDQNDVMLLALRKLVSFQMQAFRSLRIFAGLDVL